MEILISGLSPESISWETGLRKSKHGPGIRRDLCRVWVSGDDGAGAVLLSDHSTQRSSSCFALLSPPSAVLQ